MDKKELEETIRYYYVRIMWAIIISTTLILGSISSKLF